MSKNIIIGLVIISAVVGFWYYMLNDNQVIDDSLIVGVGVDEYVCKSLDGYFWSEKESECIEAIETQDDVIFLDEQEEESKKEDAITDDLFELEEEDNFFEEELNDLENLDF